MISLKIDILADLFGDLQGSVKRMTNRPHYMVCLMEYFQSHLRSGSHYRIGAVGTVSDNDVLTLVLLELQVVLNLSRTVARTQTLKRRARFALDGLFTSAYRYHLAVHLLGQFAHAVFASAAGTDQKTYVGSVKIRELYAHQDSSCGLSDRLVYCCGLACEGSAHYDLAVSSIDAAGLLDQFANAYANWNIHEYMGLIAAVKLAAHGQVFGDAGLLLLDRFCDLGYSLQVHNYRSCCRRKLGEG